MGETQIFKRLAISNIMSIDYFQMPLGRIVALSGRNGSGKSLFLDCLSLICYGELPSQLNRASGQPRHLQSAIHWATPDKKEGRRPGVTTSHIIVEMEDCNGDTFCQGISARSVGVGRSATYTYFQSEGSLEEIGAGDRQLLKTGVRMDKCGTRSEMLPEFYMRRGMQDRLGYGYLAEKAREDYLTLSRGLFSPQLGSEKGIKDIDKFVREWILPPSETEGRNAEIHENIVRINQIKESMAKRKAANDFVKRAVLLGRNYLSARRASELFEEVILPINKIYYQAEMQKCEEQVIKLSKAFELVQKMILEVEEAKNRAIEEKSIYMNPDSTVLEAKRNLEGAEANESRARILLEQAMNHEKIENAIINEYGINKREDIADSLNKLHEDCIKEIQQIEIQKSQTKEQIRTLQGVIDLLCGRFPEGAGFGREGEYLSDGKRLCDAINDAIPAAGAKMLYECVDSVKDGSWQKAVENMIGNYRYAVVVPPEYHDEALLVQERFKAGRRNTYVIKTKNLVNGPTRPARPGSVPELFVFNNRYAQYFVETTYGEVILADDDRTFLAEKRAIRKSGQHKGVSVTTKPGSRTLDNIMLIFGRSTIEKEIRNKKEEKSRLEKEYSAMGDKATELLAQGAKISSDRDAYTQSLAGYDPDARKKYDEAKKLLSEAEEAYNEAIMSDKEIKRQEMLAFYKQKLDENQKQRTACDVRANKIEEEIAEQKKDAITAKKWIDQHSDIPDTIKELDPEDEEVIQQYSIRECLGDVNIYQKRTEIRKAVRETKDILSSHFINQAIIETAFVDAPTSIESQADLDYYEEQYEAIFTGNIRSEDLRDLERLKEEGRKLLIELINTMGNEYHTALEMRENFNSYISKYQIGACFYRLSRIEINQNVENNVMLSYALKTYNGQQLTDEDLKKIETVAWNAWSSGRTKDWNVFDYRKYVKTGLEYRGQDSTYWGDAKKIIGNISTGQSSTLKYIFRIAVIAHQVFTEKSVCAILCDETLVGIDRANGKYFFDSLRQMGIQCILAYWEPIWCREADVSYCVRQDANERIKVGAAAMPEKAGGSAA